MTTTLYIGNKSFSSWSFRPWLCAKYIGLDFSEVQIALRTENTNAEINKISASNKVPCLHHNNLIIWDSLAICEYLNEIAPEKNLWPQDQKQRAHARSICAEMHSGFPNLRSELSMDMKKKIIHEPTSATQKEINRILEIWKNCLQQSKGNFLFGNFSIADAFFAPVVSRFISYGIDVGNLGKYLETISNLPFYKEWEIAAQKE